MCDAVMRCTCWAQASESEQQSNEIATGKLSIWRLPAGDTNNQTELFSALGLALSCAQGSSFPFVAMTATLQEAAYGRNDLFQLTVLGHSPPQQGGIIKWRLQTASLVTPTVKHAWCLDHFIYPYTVQGHKPGNGPVPFQAMSFHISEGKHNP